MDQLALCHLLLQGNGNRIHQLSKYHWWTKAPVPGFVGTGTIPTHRRTSPPQSRTVCMACWVQVSLPGTGSFVLFPSLGFSEAWAAWTIQGVPSHTNPASLCSAPVSITNNRRLLPLIVALNNPERAPTPPTKAEPPSLQPQLPLTQVCAAVPQKLVYLHGKRLSQETALSTQRPAWIPGKYP